MFRKPGIYLIRGIHGLFYTSHPQEMRAFIRDKLQLPFTDVGEGWLIFDLPEADMGAHPVKEAGPPSGSHEVSFYCDDIHGTVTALKERGVVFNEEVADRGYGLVTSFTMPGGVKMELYEPKYVKQRPRASSRRAVSRRRAKRKPVSRRASRKKRR